MTQQEAAKALGVSVRSLQRIVQRGQLTPTYQKGRTRPVPMFDAAEVTALQAQLCNRPIYPQSQTGTGRARKQPFGFRVAPKDIQRLAEEASRYAMRPGEYARHLVRVGLEDGLQQEVDQLRQQTLALQNRIVDLEQIVQALRDDFLETTEIVLEVTGMSSGEARRWVDENLRDGQMPSEEVVGRKRWQPNAIHRKNRKH